MKKHQEGLVRDSAILFGFTTVASVCNALFHAVMGRHLANGEYSILSSMLNTMLMIGTPLEALRISAAHYASRANMEAQVGSARRLLREWGVRLAWIAALVLVAGFFGAPYLMNYLHFSTPMLVWLTAVGVAGTLFTPLIAGTLQGLQAFISMAMSLQGLSIVRLAVGALLVMFVSQQAMTGVMAHDLGIAMSLGVGSVALWLLLHGKKVGGLSTRGVGMYLAQSLAMLAGYGLIMNMDIILVRHYLPPLDADKFSYGATIGRTIIFLPMPVAMAMFPKVVSTGALTRETRRLLLISLGIVVGLVGMGVLGCLLVPWLPLLVLYGRDRITDVAEHDVRIMISALAPMAITYVLMTFEMAQHRFRLAPWLLVFALIYLGGVSIFHASVDQVVTVLATVSAASALAFLLGVPWRGAAPASPAPPAG